GASLFLHQPRDLQHAAVHSGADRRDPGRARQCRGRDPGLGGPCRFAGAIPDRGRVPYPDLRNRAAVPGPVQAAGPVGNDLMSALAPLLSLRGVTRNFGGLTAVDHIDLDLGQGELVSIIGPNGAGKTTLFNLVTGLDRPDAGAVRLGRQGITGFSPEKLPRLGGAST